MALKVPNVGELVLLDIVRETLITQEIMLRLYKNDYTPVDGSVIGNFTECDFSGYADVELDDWGAVFTDAGKAKLVHASVQFDHDGGATANDVYGYYLVRPSDSMVLWAERFAGAPVEMDVGSDPIFVTPTLTLASES